jgi:hypothetical protein
MRKILPRRLASLALTLMLLAIPAVAAIFTAAPLGCGGSGCMFS